MNTETQYANELINFIYESPTAFHAVAKLEEILLQNDFTKLRAEDSWQLKSSGRYFTTKNDSALTAFQIGTENIIDTGFRIVAAHTDSPSFRIKPSPEMTVEDSYLVLNTEVYGGPILNTWLDRPLSLAGRVSLKSENPLNPKVELVNFEDPILIIPNLAIHMNNQVNKGIELKKQSDTLPVLSLVNKKFEKEKYLTNLIAEQINVDASNIIDFDLFLFEYEKGGIIGLNKEFISTPRLDNLESVHAGLNALIDIDKPKATNILVCFDNEEVGSATKQGADSQMLANILERIALNFGNNRDDHHRALAKSFMISADCAHAVHPAKGSKSDPTNRPKINQGPVIKISANQRYTSDSNSIAVFEQICHQAEVPVQKFVNHSDERGGSTIGPISSTHLDIRSVDVGIPLLAMHSIRELCGVSDHSYLAQALREFYRLDIPA